MAMLGIHGVLLLIAVGGPSHNTRLVPEPARRIGDSHHSFGRHRANVIALECEGREKRAL